ncbi:putative diacylglycerol O-acyltransferase tgs3 [Orchesella cincta]|uniref:diacylglycerol O-acyltransferase n=1 Tax=Orchesella cincta TaxID=48709 RepID=A0A1D2NG33_ORCCI|nr:putative diacylglycerol O-acyltransferase tgs3 [Orchesella cincta]
MVSGVERDETSSSGIVGGVSSSSVTSLKGAVRTVGIHCSSSSSSIIVSGREYQELAATAFLTSPPTVGYPGGSGAALAGNVAIPSSSNPSTTNSTIIEGTELGEHHHHHLQHLTQESVHHHHPQQQQQHHQDDELGAFRPQTVRPGRRPPPGPGFYHRTLSSSCLFSNKVQVAKSRSEYCGINQVCHSGSNYDLLSHGHNANLNPNNRNNLSSSGSIVYRSGGVGGVSNSPGGISFVDTGSLLYIKDAGELVTGFGSPTTCKTTAGSGTSGTCAALPQPTTHHQTDGICSFEQQHHQNYPFPQQFVPKRRVGGSHPDISSCRENFAVVGGTGGATNQMNPLPPIPQQQQMVGTSHQVSINIPSSSPTATRRLLPRITKKTDSSNAVVVLGVGLGEQDQQQQQHMAYSRLQNTPTTSKTISSTNALRSAVPSSLMNKDDSQQQSGFDSAYTSSGGGGGRASENINLHYRKKDFASSSSSSSSPNVRKTESLVISQKEDSLTIPRSTCTTQVILMQDSGGKSREEVYSATTAPAAATTAAANKKKLRAAAKTCTKVPSSLSPYYRNAPISKLKHPLEENIFSSLFLTLFAVGLALVIGVPILCGLGVILIGAIGLRYCFAVLNGFASYTRYLCSNRAHPASRSRPPNIFPRDRLAFANDVRWLGRRRASRCQSILHTLLVFEGSMDVSTLRHLIQTRVLRAETPEGELAYPRLLQKLVSVTAGYLWELDLAFDIQNHIFPGPNHFQTEQQLQNYIGHLLTQSLPYSRPLWEIRVLPSYYGGGKDTMAILRVHQCLADGMSLIRILSHALADHQQMHIPQRPHFAGMSFGFNVIRSLIVGPVTIFLWWFATFRDKTLFSIPLPKLRKRRRRKLIQRWRAWWCARRDGGGDTDEDNDAENEYVMSYGSTISHTSSDSTYSSKSSLHSRSSRGSSTSSSSANARGKFVRAFRSPLSPSYSLRNELNPQVASSNPASSTRLQPGGGEPGQCSTGGQQSTAQPTTPLLSSSARQRSLVEGILPKGVLKSRHLNTRCLGKRTTSRSSIKSQNQQQGRDITSPTTTTQRKFQRRKAGAGAKKRKKKKRKRRRRFGGGKGKGSLKSTTSSSTFSSGSESPPTWNVIWSAPMSVPKVARVKQIMRSSYNDVLLSAAAGSVRTYLQEQGIPYPGDVQVVIPVDLRNDIASPKQSTRLGCKVASVLATVPSGMESAIPRLWATRHRLEELKASADSVVAYGATAILMNILPHRLAIPILESITNKVIK